MTDNKQYPEMPEPTAWRTYDNLLKRARYNAMPITSMQPGIYSHTRMFTEDQMYAYVDADRAMRAANAKPVAWRRLCYREWEYEDGITSFEHDPSAQALYTEPQATPASQDAEDAMRWMQVVTVAESAAREHAMSEWQPIATAPKDVLILLYGAKRMEFAVGMNHSRDGWVSASTAEFLSMYPPTHWMPLPHRPKAA